MILPLYPFVPPFFLHNRVCVVASVGGVKIAEALFALLLACDVMKQLNIAEIEAVLRLSRIKIWGHVFLNLLYFP